MGHGVSVIKPFTETLYIRDPNLDYKDVVEMKPSSNRIGTDNFRIMDLGFRILVPCQSSEVGARAVITFWKATSQSSMYRCFPFICFHESGTVNLMPALDVPLFLSFESYHPCVPYLIHGAYEDQTKVLDRITYRQSTPAATPTHRIPVPAS